MPDYNYVAYDRQGKKITGVKTAKDTLDLHMKLKQEGLFLVSEKDNSKKKHTKPLKEKEVADFSREVGTLLGAGVSLVRAMNIIIEEENVQASVRSVLEEVLRLIRQGIPLSEAMEQQDGAFPTLLINMYRSAEASGNLDKTAMRMAEHFEKEYRLKKKVQSAMTYPKILGVMIVAIVVIIMAYVIPQFEDLFAGMEQLPAATAALLAVSDFVVQRWYVIAVTVIVIYLLVSVLSKVEKIRYAIDKAKLHMPLIGKLQKTIFTARFARTLSSLYASGLPIITALQISRKTIGNLYIDAQFDEVIQFIRGGGNLSEGLEKIDGFVKKMTASIRIGEETGHLESMLDAMADTLDYDAEMATQKMVSYMEPVMIVIMAVIVGFIMIAVIKPIYGSYETIGTSTSNY